MLDLRFANFFGNLSKMKKFNYPLPQKVIPTRCRKERTNNDIYCNWTISMKPQLNRCFSVVYIDNPVFFFKRGRTFWTVSTPRMATRTFRRPLEAVETTLGNYVLGNCESSHHPNFILSIFLVYRGDTQQSRTQ